jgi:hypothetical protein
MRESDQTWDVVVVGASGGGRAEVLELASALARESSRTSSTIQHALLSGELEMHHALTRDDAEAAQERLVALGARVVLRPTENRAAGGPPSIGLAGLPQLEPDPEPTTRRASSTDEIRIEAIPDPVPIRGLVGSSPRRSSPRARLTPANPEQRELEDRETSVYEPVQSRESPATKKPVARRVASRKPASPKPARTRPAGPDTVPKPGGVPPGRTPTTAPGLEPDEKLELDLAAVKRPDRSELAGPAASASVSTSTNASASASASFSASYGAGSVAAPRRLLGSDSIATLLFGLAIGAVIGIVVALATTRGVTSETLLPLEEELAESLSRALEVERGRLRSPQAIEADIDQALSKTRRRFFLVWLGVAIPLGLVLGRMKIGED